MDSLDYAFATLRPWFAEVGVFLPRFLLALLIAVAGWLIAKALRFAVIKALRSINFHVLTERARGLASPRLLAGLMESYAGKFTDADGRLRATLELGWALAWKPHASQQKPLKPGSAAHKLADALNKTRNQT